MYHYIFGTSVFRIMNRALRSALEKGNPDVSSERPFELLTYSGEKASETAEPGDLAHDSDHEDRCWVVSGHHIAALSFMPIA